MVVENANWHLAWASVKPSTLFLRLDYDENAGLYRKSSFATLVEYYSAIYLFSTQSSRNDMFGTIRFGDLTPADIAQVIDPSAIVPYHVSGSSRSIYPSKSRLLTDVIRLNGRPQNHFLNAQV